MIRVRYLQNQNVNLETAGGRVIEIDWSLVPIKNRGDFWVQVHTAYSGVELRCLFSDPDVDMSLASLVILQPSDSENPEFETFIVSNGNEPIELEVREPGDLMRAFQVHQLPE